MAVSIRLRREGAKNRPYYKVVVADSRSPRDGKFIEIIGTYDPKVKGDNSTLKVDRVEHWIARGAQPSDTVRSLLKKNKARGSEAPAEEKTVPSETAKAAKPAAAEQPAVREEPVAVEPAVTAAPVDEEPAESEEIPAK